jgi:hypothetical protein
VSLEPQTRTEPVRAYREIPFGSSACTVCDEPVELKLSASRVGRRTPIKAHGPRGNRCPGGLQPGKLWLEASNLPSWDELTDIDKGCALMFVWKCHWERDFSYARENYPAIFRDHPALVDLPRNAACIYARAVCQAGEPYRRGETTHDVVSRRLGHDEHDRLYNLALDAERVA